MGKSYQSFEEMLRNIFQPIFEATLNPEENENIHIFLSNIGGFDYVDDESKYDPLMFDETLQFHHKITKKQITIFLLVILFICKYFCIESFKRIEGIKYIYI